MLVENKILFAFYMAGWNLTGITWHELLPKRVKEKPKDYAGCKRWDKESGASTAQ
jgi:hypothetical protein